MKPKNGLLFHKQVQDTSGGNQFHNEVIEPLFEILKTLILIFCLCSSGGETQ